MKYMKSTVMNWYYPKDYPPTNPVVLYKVVLDERYGLIQNRIGVLPLNPSARARVWCWAYLPEIEYDEGEHE